MLFFLATSPLVHLNALLNVTATVLLIAGLLLIKRGRVTAHKRVMLTAFVVSIAFLAGYVIYHAQVGDVKFTHPGFVRYVYLTVLFTHIPLAVTVPFLAVWQIYLGYRATGCCAAGRDGNADLQAMAAYAAKHRRLACWSFPIWLYVSVTGVVVYVMLYHLWPPVE